MRACGLRTISIPLLRYNSWELQVEFARSNKRWAWLVIVHLRCLCYSSLLPYRHSFCVWGRITLIEDWWLERQGHPSVGSMCRWVVVETHRFWVWYTTYTVLLSFTQCLCCPKSFSSSWNLGFSQCRTSSTYQELIHFSHRMTMSHQRQGFQRKSLPDSPDIFSDVNMMVIKS